MQTTFFWNLNLICEDRFQPECIDFGSMKGRIFSLMAFFKIIILLPFVILGRSIRTFFKGLGVLFSMAGLVLCLGKSEGMRAFFLSRLVSFAQDIGDWFCFLFILALELCRAFFGFLIHPALYFHL